MVLHLLLPPLTMALHLLLPPQMLSCILMQMLSGGGYEQEGAGGSKRELEGARGS